MKQWKVAVLCLVSGTLLGYGAAYWVEYSRCVTTSRELREDARVRWGVIDFTEPVSEQCRHWTTESIGWRP